MLAHRARTSLALAGSAGAILAALLVSPRETADPPTAEVGDDGMRLEARLPSSRILPGAMEHDLAVTITAPGRSRATRPPLALAIVLDRSGSMTDSELAQPLSDARAAAARLVAQLDPGDAFAIVTYSSGDETVSPMARATPAHKAEALAALETIVADGGTCISCGLTRGAHELAASPLERGLRRMVLISDGLANQGIHDRGQLAALAAETAARGTSISTVGVGLEFDEVTMAHLASVGRGRYHFVEDTRELDAMFRRELADLGETIAAGVRLVVAEQPGVRVVGAYGYPITRSGSHVIVPIADLRAGEVRKVVLRVAVEPHALGETVLARLELGWTRVADGVSRRATAGAHAVVVEDPEEALAHVDPEVVELVEQARTARALDEAAEVLATHGADAARQVLERRAGELRANRHLAPDVARGLERASTEAAEALRGPARRAIKVNRIRAYQLAR